MKKERKKQRERSRQTDRATERQRARQRDRQARISYEAGTDFSSKATPASFSLSKMNRHMSGCTGRSTPFSWRRSNTKSKRAVSRKQQQTNKQTNKQTNNSNNITKKDVFSSNCSRNANSPGHGRVIGRIANASQAGLAILLQSTNTQ